MYINEEELESKRTSIKRAFANARELYDISLVLVDDAERLLAEVRELEAQVREYAEAQPPI